MGYALGSGISFCDVSERLLFLDLVADRYFCLSDNVEQSFRSLIAGDESADGEWLVDLLRASILIETPDERLPQPFHRASPPLDSMLDAPARAASINHKLAAISTLGMTQLSLRLGSLHRTLGKLAAAKAAEIRAHGDTLQTINEVSSAFEWTARMVRSHDQCLPRSIAAVRRLAALGVPADLVIGVRLRPFAAHSWAEADGWLVNDRFDTVRTYTPIASV